MKELTQAEITTLNAYRQVFDNITREFGTIAILQKDLNTRRENVENALDENRKGQQDYLNSLQEKYGQGQLDLDRGLFIPALAKDEEALVDPKEEEKKAKPSKKKS